MSNSYVQFKMSPVEQNKIQRDVCIKVWLKMLSFTFRPHLEEDREYKISQLHIHFKGVEIEIS